MPLFSLLALSALCVVAKGNIQNATNFVLRQRQMLAFERCRKRQRPEG